jgi:hypothetical protein
MRKIYSVEKVSVEWLGIPTPWPFVLALGTTPPGGWTQGVLEEHIYSKPPKDGIQGFDFRAMPPSGNSSSALTNIPAARVLTQDLDNYWGKGKPLRGVRVVTVTNEEQFEIKNGKSSPTLMGDDDSYPLARRLEKLPKSLAPFFRVLGDEDPYPLAIRMLARLMGDDSPYPLAWHGFGNG